MRLDFKHSVYLFFIIYGLLIGLFILNDIDVFEGMGLFILAIVAVLVTTLLFQFLLLLFSSQLSFWVNPVLKLVSVLVQLDDKIDEFEIKKLKKHLKKEFADGLALKKFRFLIKQLQKNDNEIEETLLYLSENSTGSDKIKTMQFLIGIAVSDRYLTENEEEFILNISKRLGMPRSTLNLIYGLYNYVSEKEKIHSRTINSAIYILRKSYEILELKPEATLQEVKESHRRLVKIFHPDVRNKLEISKESAEEQFQRITDAYETIKKEKG
jgi:DnaJ-domain-containing protein 1